MEEITKCFIPNMQVPMCRQCKRSEPQKQGEEFETFALKNTQNNGIQCDGYVSKKQEKGLFDE